MNDGIVPVSSAEIFDGEIGDDLVCIHVRRGPRATLHRVNDKRVRIFPCDQLVTGVQDRICLLRRKRSELSVHLRGGLFHNDDIFDELPIHTPHRDRKILPCTHAVDAVNRILRQKHLSQPVRFFP